MPSKNQRDTCSWAVTFTRGKRGEQEKLTVFVLAQSPSSARKYGIDAAKARGADWAKSARAHTQKMGK